MNIPSVWTDPFIDFFNNNLLVEAAKKFRLHQLPTDIETWKLKREELVKMLWEKLGVSVDHNLNLDYHETGSLKMDGYVIKNIYYQSRPGIYVTGNLYIPNGKKQFPAVINMHGHWPQGRLAERVQARGHSLALNGYVCLSVDAFGAGERSSMHGQFEYHGGNLGASLMNIGETLMGAQIIDNMRAIDLLCSFNFVDNKNIGATGASGGGNQTMWLAALDDRITAAMPVASVGSFESYVTRHNCICETITDGLTFTEESGILALTAPRALKICNCLLDSNPTFFVTEMLRSFNEAKKVFQTLGAYEKFSYQSFNLPHGYWPEIRESMLGWFDLHLKGIGNGMPKQEKPFMPLSEEKLMVFKKGHRSSFVTGIAEYCRKKGNNIKQKTMIKDNFKNSSKVKELKEILKISKWIEIENIHEYSQEGIWKKFALDYSDGGMLPVLVAGAENSLKEFVLFSHPSGKSKVSENSIEKILEQKKGVILADLWGTGETHIETVPLYDITSRSALLLGKSMQGEWARQIELLSNFAFKYLKASDLSIHAYKETGVAALLLNAVKNVHNKIILEECPVSYLFQNTVPPDYFSMAIHLPGIIEWGDISLAAAMSNADIIFIFPVMSDGKNINPEQAQISRKEFDFMIATCKSKTNVFFNRGNCKSQK